MAKCFFCGKSVGVGRGIMYVTLDSRILHFCSSKCRKHFKLGRSKKQKWIIKQRQK